jgi:S-adenosylmethionine/arginine decarboxylase-like enzyme
MTGEAASKLTAPDKRYARPPRAAPMKAVEVDDMPTKKVDGKTRHWGYHLILDVSDCNQDVDNPSVVAAFLKEMVEVLKMVAVGEPLVHQFTDPRGRGTSGVQIITTSSLTFHSDDVDWAAYIDVFSCKQFEPQVAIDLTVKYFEPKHIGKLFLYRDAGPWPEK